MMQAQARSDISDMLVELLIEMATDPDVAAINR